ncbi:hypothetical protein Hanom_Chr09g00793721 [Helianthus anomalus]
MHNLETDNSHKQQQQGENPSTESRLTSSRRRERLWRFIYSPFHHRRKIYLMVVVIRRYQPLAHKHINDTPKPSSLSFISFPFHHRTARNWRWC